MNNLIKIKEESKNLKNEILNLRKIHNVKIINKLLNFNEIQKKYNFNSKWLNKNLKVPFEHLKIDKELKQNLMQIKQNIPTQDLIHEYYDSKSTNKIKKLLIIFSTPRSGSTMFCDMLKQNEICIAHEYLQPHQYFPILAERWGCIAENNVDLKNFLSMLIHKRTFSNGILGINIHGSHIYLYEIIKHLIDKVETEYIVLKRNDIISQAISYEIASQTGKWSSFFNENKKPEYHFDNILKRIKSIHGQNLLIESFIKKENIKAFSLEYETIVDSVDIFNKELSLFLGTTINRTVSIHKKQANNINENWKAHFYSDFYRLKNMSSSL